MNIDELRDLIWEHLFHAQAAKSMTEIAAFTSCDLAAVSAAVNHEWFAISEHGVSIAYVAPTVGDRR